MRETRDLEFKENISSNSYMKTISAYANYGTGKIVFGVADDGNVVGISDPVSCCLSLENKINDSMKPVPEYSLSIQEDHTICLTVEEGMHKPYLYKGKAYKRHDSATVEVDSLEYKRLIMEGVNLSFEELTSDEQELSFSRLEEELKHVMSIDELNMDILKTLELYSVQRGYNYAAALLADQNSFPGIDMVRFGASIDEIMDRETLEQVSILEQLSGSINMFRKYYQYEKIEGSERRTIEKIPEKAFREAIANALVHRTWDVRAAIKVSMYDDYIEISSPGGLPSGIGKEEYLDGQVSILRNPIIGNVFYRLKYIERFGTGILRINQAYKNALEKPAFKIYENAIVVSLPVIKTDEVLSGDERSIYEILRRYGALSRAELEKTTGFERSKVIRNLNAMLEKNIIMKHGRGRAVKYSIM